MEDINIGKSFRIFLHFKKKLILYSAIIFGCLIGLILSFAPQYEVTTLLLIEDQNSDMKLPSAALSLLAGNMMQPQNQHDLELFKSRFVLDQIIKKYNLQYPVARKGTHYIDYLYRKFSGKPEYVGSLYFSKIFNGVPSSGGEVIVEKDSYRIKIDGNEVKCAWNTDCVVKDGVIQVVRIGEIPDNTVFEFGYRNMIQTRKMLREFFTVKPAGEDSNQSLLRVSAKSDSPYFAAIILNTLSDIFGQSKITWQREKAKKSLEYIEKILKQIEVQRSEKREMFTVFMSEKRTLLPDDQVKAIVAQKIDLQTQEQKLDLQIGLLEEYERVLASGRDTALGAPVFLDDKALADMITTYNDLIFEEQKLSELYSPSHPDLILAKDQINSTKKVISTIVKNMLLNSREMRSILQRKISSIEGDMSKLPVNVNDYATLKADVLLIEKVYAFLMEKYYETQIKLAATNTGIIVIDPAEYESQKVFPVFSLFVIVAGFISLFCGMLIVFFKYYRNATVLFREDVSSCLSDKLAPTILSIPPEKQEALSLSREFFIGSGFFSSLPRVLAIAAQRQSSSEKGWAFSIADLCAEMGFNVTLVTFHSDVVQHQESGAEDKARTGCVSVVPFSPGDTFFDKQHGFAAFIARLKQKSDIVILDAVNTGQRGDEAGLFAEADMVVIAVEQGLTLKSWLKGEATLISSCRPTAWGGVVLFPPEALESKD